MKIIEYIEEDCPFNDETTEFLGIKGKGTMNLISRDQGIAACTEEIIDSLEKLGIYGKCVANREKFGKGDMICHFRGDLRKLFKIWRTVQTILSITCAIATYTKEMVEKARKVNPDVIIATTRKTHPGMRQWEICAVLCGDGTIHRNSLSDSVLVTKNHLNVVETVHIKHPIRTFEMEPRNWREAIKYAKIADVILLDHFSPVEMKELTKKIREINKNVKIAVSGDITKINVKEYAENVDIIVTSAPYYATPLNFTTEIQRTL